MEKNRKLVVIVSPGLNKTTVLVHLGRSSIVAICIITFLGYHNLLKKVPSTKQRTEKSISRVTYLQTLRQKINPTGPKKINNQGGIIIEAINLKLEIVSENNIPLFEECCSLQTCLKPNRLGITRFAIPPFPVPLLGVPCGRNFTTFGTTPCIVQTLDKQPLSGFFKGSCCSP